MKTDEACTRRGMWCMNIQDSFLICQKKPSRWSFNLRHTLPFGIGLHHAGLNEEDRSLTCLVTWTTTFRNPLQNLESIQANFTGRRSHRKSERSDDFDCTLCLKLLYEPVTTPCGHFMPISVNGSSVTLNGIIQKNFPEEFAEMKLENDTMTNFGVDLMPLFVMDGVFLFQKFSLHVF
ncbi:unnamed protein product [Prunus brigantina]